MALEQLNGRAQRILVDIFLIGRHRVLRGGVECHVAPCDLRVALKGNFLRRSGFQPAGIWEGTACLPARHPVGNLKLALAFFLRVAVDRTCRRDIDMETRVLVRINDSYPSAQGLDFLLNPTSLNKPLLDG